MKKNSLLKNLPLATVACLHYCGLGETRRRPGNRERGERRSKLHSERPPITRETALFLNFPRKGELDR